jgi:hypothetical protein
MYINTIAELRQKAQEHLLANEQLDTELHYMRLDAYVTAVLSLNK